MNQHDHDDEGLDDEPRDKPPGGKPCPGCGRSRKACWIMPCLYLETLLEKSDERDPGAPSASLRAWAKAGGDSVQLRRET